MSADNKLTYVKDNLTMVVGENTGRNGQRRSFIVKNNDDELNKLEYSASGDSGVGDNLTIELQDGTALKTTYFQVGGEMLMVATDETDPEVRSHFFLQKDIALVESTEKVEISSKKVNFTRVPIYNTKQEALAANEVDSTGVFAVRDGSGCAQLFLKE